MAEEKVQKEVPVEVLTKEAQEMNKKIAEEAKAALTPPEGQVFVGMRAFCPVHGDITQASKIIKHTRFMKSEETGKIEPVSFSDVICLACVSDMWRGFMANKMPKDKDGNPAQIQLSPIFMKKEEVEKMQEAAKEAAEKAKADATKEETAE